MTIMILKSTDALPPLPGILKTLLSCRDCCCFCRFPFPHSLIMVIPPGIGLCLSFLHCSFDMIRSRIRMGLAFFARRPHCCAVVYIHSVFLLPFLSISPPLSQFLCSKRRRLPVQNVPVISFLYTQRSQGRCTKFSTMMNRRPCGFWIWQ